jgi:hypothetical protein
MAGDNQWTGRGGPNRGLQSMQKRVKKQRRTRYILAQERTMSTPQPPAQPPSPPPTPPSAGPPPAPPPTAAPVAPAAAAKPQEQKEVTGAALHFREIAELLKLMGQVVNNAALYSPEHKLTVQSFEKSYECLVKVLELVPRLNLSMADANLLVDGKAPGVSNPFINVLAAKLDQLEIAGFSLLKGMSLEEFGKLMELLITTKSVEGTGFADLLSESGMEHVYAEKVKYQRVSDGDMVVDKGEADKDKVAAETVQQIMAFLRGDPTAGPGGGGDGSGGISDDVARGLSGMANSSAEELAGIIMEAVTVRQKTIGIASGETLGDIVVGCLRRTFDGLLKDPASRTQKGKKAIKRTLMVLEKSILEKLHGMTPDPDPALDAAISQAIEEMTDDIEIDSLSADYAKKAQALEKTESRMLRYMNTHGEDEEAVKDLEQRLTESGLSMDGWRKLVVKSDAVTAPIPIGPNAPPEVGMLAILLKELNEMMSAPPDPKTLGQKLAEVDRHVKTVSTFTEKRIDELGEVVAAEQQDGAGRLSRKALVALLAEITQELCQSVSAIHCSVSMTLAGHVGDINEDQREVLTVAADCTHRLDQLLDRLIHVVGVPQGLTPDKEMVYNKPLGKA